MALNFEQTIKSNKRLQTDNLQAVKYRLGWELYIKVKDKENNTGGKKRKKYF